MEEQPQNQTENGGNTERMIRKETVWKMRDSGEEKLSEQVEELLSKMSKTRKRIQMRILTVNIKKTASIVIIIVILLILLWNIPMRRGKKLRKGENGVKENKANKKKEGSCCGGTVIITMILSFMFFLRVVLFK